MIAATAQAIDWKRLLESSTRDVFQSMLGCAATPATYNGGAVPPPADFTILVGLTGDLRGALTLRCQSMAAHRLTMRILGDEAFPDEDVSDALGEIASQVAKRLQARMQDIQAGGAESIESCFVFYGQPFWLNLWYTGLSPQK